MVADAIEAALGVEIDKRRVELGKPIKVAGEHEVTVSIYRNIKAAVKVVVAGEDDVVEEAVEEVEEVVETAEAAEAAAEDAE